MIHQQNQPTVLKFIPMDKLKFIYANINSYAPKKHLVHYYAQTNNIDCIMCVETKSKENTSPLNNWDIIQQKGNIVNTNIRGGSLVQAKQQVKLGKANPPAINNTLNSCLHFTIPFRKSKLHILLVYIHPTSLIEETIFTKAALYEYCVIIGDFNPSARKKQQLNFFLQNSDFVRMNTPPTFIMTNNPSTTPDIILCTQNIRKNINTSLTSDLGSDHLSILWTLDTTIPPEDNYIEETKYNIQKCNIEVVNQKLGEFLQEEKEINGNFIEEFNEKISDLVTSNSPKLRKKKFNYELPPFIVALIKKKRKLYRQIKQNDNDSNLKRQFNDLNKGIHNLIGDFKQDKWIKCCNNINRLNGKNYWTEIKKLSKYRATKSPVPMLQQGNTVLDSDLDKANAFAEYYENLFMDNSKNDVDEQTVTVNEWFDEFFSGELHTVDIQIEDDEYKQVIAEGQNTAPGYDNINRNILRQLSPEIHTKIKQIYSYCLTNGYFPNTWKKGTVITIPKPNADHSRLENYRPITLLPVLGKNLEKIVRNRINREIGRNIPGHQFGFKQGHSTIHPLSILTSNIQSSNVMGFSSAATFLDIKRAFDTVWHRGLLFKLYQLECPRYLMGLVKKFLENRQNVVKINGSLSYPFSNEQGIPQGSTLSPLLYNIFCHDIFPPTNQITVASPYVIQFADDTAIISHHKSISKAVQSLQVALNRVIVWLDRWKLKVNPEKSQFIIFHHKISEASPKLDILNHQIPPQSHIKYLGIHFDNKLNFKYHLSAMKKKTITRSKHFRNLTYKDEGINIKTAGHIYTTICRPLLEYGQIIFSACRGPAIQIIETAERTSLRKITKIRHPTNPLHNPSNEMLYQKTGIEPIIQRFQSLTEKFGSRPSNIAIISPFILEIPQGLIRKRQYPEQTVFQIIQNNRL